MKQLSNMFGGNELKYHLQDSQMMTEGKVGDWFKKTFTYLKSKIARIGNAFVALFRDQPIPAVLPITSQSAWKKGFPDSKCMHWVGTSEDKRFSGVPTDGNQILKSRQGSLDYWKSIPIIESKSDAENVQKIYEVKLQNDDSQIMPVDADELKDLIREVIRGGGRTRPLLIYGAPGVGKTQIVKAVLKEVKGEGSRMLDFQLSLKEHDDFFLPTYAVNDKGERVGAIDLPKSYLPVYKPCDDDALNEAADKACGSGLIFLDELTQAKPSVQGVMLKFVNDRVLGEDYKLGSGWSIIAAANREDDGVGAYDLNTALLDRFDVVNYEPSVKTWRKWAEKHGYMNPHILDWLEQNSKYFYYSSDDQNSNKVCSPRDWEAACLRLATYAQTAEEEGFDLLRIPDNTIKRSIWLSCGADVANFFMEYVRLIRTIDVKKLESVWTKPNDAPLPKKEGATYKVDLMYIITTQIIAMMKHQPTPEEWANACTYFARLDSESAAGKFLKSACAKWPELNDEFGQFDGHDKYAKGVEILSDAYPRWASDETDIQWNHTGKK